MMFHRTAIWFAASLSTCLLAGQPAAFAADDAAPAPASETQSAETYYISKTLDLPFEEALPIVKDAITAQKFSILFEIDFQAKVKEKLQLDIPRYLVLGACSAKWAHAMWLSEPHVGALLPCNCVLRELPDGKTEVFFKNPSGMPTATGNADIEDESAAVRAIVDTIMASLPEASS